VLDFPRGATALCVCRKLIRHSFGSGILRTSARAEQFCGIFGTLPLYCCEGGIIITNRICVRRRFSRSRGFLNRGSVATCMHWRRSQQTWPSILAVAADPRRDFRSEPAARLG